MKITIDTDVDSLEDLQNALSVVVNAIEKKGGKIVMQQSAQQKKPNTENAYVKRLMEQEKLMETLDISPILQSDFGIQKKRQELLHKKENI